MNICGWSESTTLKHIHVLHSVYVTLSDTNFIALSVSRLRWEHHISETFILLLDHEHSHTKVHVFPITLMVPVKVVSKSSLPHLLQAVSELSLAEAHRRCFHWRCCDSEEQTCITSQFSFIPLTLDISCSTANLDCFERFLHLRIHSYLLCSTTDNMQGNMQLCYYLRKLFLPDPTLKNVCNWCNLMQSG